MDVDVRGRVNNVILSTNKALNPVFEAIVNSIDAVEECNSPNGQINIIVERDKSQQVLTEEDEQFQRIDSFKIIDNGIGFNDSNYQSFNTADTSYKSKQGGKGIGRFTWLKAFEKVTIESIYTVEHKTYKRTFDFTYSKYGIENSKLQEIEPRSKNSTTVHLKNYKEDYKNKCSIDIEIIKDEILDHLLIYFLSSDCPQIYLEDEDLTLDLNSEFKSNVKKHLKNEKHKIKNDEFNLTHLHLFKTKGNNHYLHLCANNREVKKYNISKYVPNLHKKIFDEKEEDDFLYSCYVSSEYLDNIVNSERTGFNFLEEDQNLLENEISEKELLDGLVYKTKKHLSEYLEKIEQDKYTQIEEYAKYKAPQYRPLLKHKELLEKIPSNLTEQKLDIELHKTLNSLETDLKEKGKEYLSYDLEDIKDAEEYKTKLKEFIDEINDIGKSKLADYILHRKVILELFEKTLQKDKNSQKYKLEENIHEIIFPLKHTSDDIGYEQQNLWIIDEKLSYHYFLSSDKPLYKIGSLETESKDRPDIVIFNQPLAFVEDEPPYSSIVIIEFKRPARETYTEDSDNPISQIYDYISKIKESRKTDAKGRPINVGQNTPFYCYIICDLTSKIIDIAERLDFTKTPDNLGYFGYNKNFSAYLEIISYDKLLSDSKKRNRILFDKLQLPNA